MEQHEQERFERLYAQHFKALKLQDNRGKMIDCDARAVGRNAGSFNRCPYNLSPDDLARYFAWMLESYFRQQVNGFLLFISGDNLGLSPQRVRYSSPLISSDDDARQKL